MGLEAATYISQLIETNPLGADVRGQGDNHLRLIKQVLKNTFPNADRAVPVPLIVTSQIGANQAAAAFDLGAQQKFSWQVTGAVDINVNGTTFTALPASDVGALRLIRFNNRSTVLTPSAKLLTGTGSKPVNLLGGACVLFQSLATDTWQVMLAFGGGSPASLNNRQLYDAAQSVNTVDLAYSNNLLIDASLSNSFRVAPLTGNSLIHNPTLPADGQNIQVRFKQDGTGGRTLTYQASWLFSGNDQPNGDPGTRSLISATYDGSVGNWLAVMTQFGS